VRIGGNFSFDIWIAKADGEEARRLTSIAASTIRQLDWSPDDRRIAYHARFGTLALFQV
jgi:hypothetical protein